LSSDRLKFFVGLNTGYATVGRPDARFVEFYRLRSSPALHCAIVGNVVIPRGYGTNANSATISTAPIWAELANAIASRGSLPGVQLATTWEGYLGSRSFRSPNACTTITRLPPFETRHRRGCVDGSFVAASGEATAVSRIGADRDLSARRLGGRRRRCPRQVPP
jgi:hypothetical protein